jgi:alpha-D-ribose 1-methylphosphonate 5-triphosphate diphosphatase
MSSSLTFINAKVVLPNEVMKGHVHVVDGRIASIDLGLLTVLQTHDCENDFLMPGFIEVHTDNFERHLLPRPKTHWPTIPALLAHDAEIAAAGITTVFDAMGVGDIDPESLRGGSLSPVIQTIDDCIKRDILRSDHYLHVRCELPAPNTLPLFEPFMQHERLKLVSLMDHTPGQRQWENINDARIYYTGKKGWSEEKFQQQIIHAKRLQTENAIPNRSFLVEFCRDQFIRLASHDDTTSAHVEQAHQEGAVISEFPTTVLAAQKAHVLGLKNVMGAPNVVRGGSHSGNVAAVDLARLKLLDLLSSDYVPGSLLTAAMILANEGVMTLPQAISLVSENPAQACGMTDRGQIDAGKRADLIQVRAVKMADGSLQGVVRSVWRAGRRVI